MPGREAFVEFGQSRSKVLVVVTPQLFLSCRNAR